ncbi:SARP family transcriptional regulator [Deinococcus aerius]|uniref:SARP family transcriptional regulator n=1 Tax=Deinococcus aerius TaxID=200253 RepID=A0A2I9CW62_9DEIO|nr:AAA family ATPase [Deinococcus aerius]GBF06224.1 SARP family transcriptional regulator [Deinococcus aerius]
MLTIHLLGHAHLSRDGQPVPVSAKAVALITYLSIEKLPQHRERLADLLWTTAEARKNLRVELARIRTAGLNLFPASRQLLYLENVTTDFDLWQARAEQDMNQAQLSDWLAMLRGFPLSGLEDLGSSTFKEWVDQQRWILSQQIEEGLSRVYWRYARAEQAWALRLIAARADTLGFELTTEAPEDPHPADLPAPRGTGVPAPEPDQAPELHFGRPQEEQMLERVLRDAEREPQVIVLHGPPGIGKSYHVERAAASGGWQTVRVTDTRSSRLVLASLAQAALRESEAGGAEAEALRRLLLAPTSLEEDAVKVAVALARLRRPLLLVFDHVHDAPGELAPLLTFLTQVPSEGPRALVLLSRQRAAQAPLTRALRARVGSACRELELPPLTRSSVQQALEGRLAARPARTLHGEAARLVQRSEGNPLHLLSLLGPAGEPGDQDMHFPQAVRDSYGTDIDGWPPTLVEAMTRLSAIYGHFDRRVAQAALGEGLAASTDALLYEALERHILREVEAGGTLEWPGLTLRPAPQGAETLYTFVSEGLRIALASRSPQLIRQDVRRRLVPALAEDSPGLAAYYARRGGLTEEAERLQRVYRAGLQDRQLPGAGRRSVSGSGSPVPEPRRTPAAPHGPVAAQGYQISRDNNGWLNIWSVGRYGHPQTLRLHLPLPPASGEAGLRLVWRLDVFSGGEELGPQQLPFPLRVGLRGSGMAHVLTRTETPDYLEEEVRHAVHAGVVTEQWMEHHLTFPAPAEGGAILELSVRALDLALTVGALTWQGQDLLAAVPVPALRPAPLPGAPLSSQPGAPLLKQVR